MKVLARLFRIMFARHLKRLTCDPSVLRNCGVAVRIIGLMITGMVPCFAAPGPAFADSSFETPNIGVCPNLEYAPGGTPWNFTSAGITTGGCHARFNAPALPPGGGTQAAFIQSAGSSISQTVDGFESGQSYQITFYAAGRPAGAGCDDNCTEINFSVFVGSTDVLDVVNPPTGTFQQYTTKPFTAVGPVTISFTGMVGEGQTSDAASFIDLISISYPEVGAPTLADPVPDLLNGPQITTAVTAADTLAATQPYLADLSKGRTVQGVASDGVAQIVIRIPAASVGQTFTIAIDSSQCSATGLSESACIDEYGLVFDPTNPPGNPSDLFANMLPQNASVTAVSTPNGPMAFAAYRAPSDFVRSGLFNASDQAAASRSVIIDINQGQQPNLTVNVVRPPLILIHGFNTDSSAWDDFVPLVNDTAQFAIFKVNYGMFLYGRTNLGLFTPLTNINITTTNPPPTYVLPFYEHVRRSHLGFSFNARYVTDDIQTFLQSFVSGTNPVGIAVAANGVDIVGHSMGGLVARYLTVPANYLASRNYKRGYVHKIITLGTPHFGTPQAILSLLPQSSCSRALAAAGGSLSFLTASLSSGEVLPGASGELSGDGIGVMLSPALESLVNAATALQVEGIPLPMATIAGDIEPIKSNVNSAPLAEIPKEHCPGDPLAERFTGAEFDTTFDPLITSANPNGGPGGPTNAQNGRENDGSVPLTSAVMNPNTLTFGLCPELQCFDSYSHSSGIAVFFGSWWHPIGGGIHFLQDGSSIVSNQVVMLLNTSINDPIFGTNR